MAHNNIDWNKKSSFKTAQQSPGLLLWQVSSAWRRCIEDALSKHDLTHVQFVLLASTGWLSREGALVSQTDLARHGKLDVNMTSQVIRALERRGLVVRQQIEGNERSKFCSLTAEGASLLSNALPAVEQADISFFSRLSQSEVASFCTLLSTLEEEQ